MYVRGSGLCVGNTNMNQFLPIIPYNKSLTFDPESINTGSQISVIIARIFGFLFSHSLKNNCLKSCQQLISGGIDSERLYLKKPKCMQKVVRYCIHFFVPKKVVLL